MLLKSNISKILIHSDEWFNARLAKFTSSEFHFLMSPEGIGSVGLNYIYRKVGEELTGMPCRKEISTEATEHGHEYEPENIREFGKAMGIEFLVTQALIIDQSGKFGSTPDAMWIVGERSDELSYDVFTMEAKCPTAYDNFIHLWNCKTPAELKKKNKIYYWQVLHQMRMAGALRGYLSIYNPFFKSGKQNIIEFRKTELISEFKLIEERGNEAVIVFVEQRNKMIAA